MAALPDCSLVNPEGPLAPPCGLPSVSPPTLGSSELKRDNIWVSPGPQWPSCLLASSVREQPPLPPVLVSPSSASFECHPLRQGPKFGTLLSQGISYKKEPQGPDLQRPLARATAVPVIVGGQSAPQRSSPYQTPDPQGQLSPRLKDIPPRALGR